jgi:hypothetical protein
MLKYPRGGLGGAPSFVTVCIRYSWAMELNNGFDL